MKVPVPLYGVVPPVPVTVTVDCPPLQLIEVFVELAANTAGWVIVMLVVAAQPFASVTV